MAVAIYVTGISTPDVHPEFPPLLGTLTIYTELVDCRFQISNRLLGENGSPDSHERVHTRSRRIRLT